MVLPATYNRYSILCADITASMTFVLWTIFICCHRQLIQTLYYPIFRFTNELRLLFVPQTIFIGCHCQPINCTFYERASSPIRPTNDLHWMPSSADSKILLAHCIHRQPICCPLRMPLDLSWPTPISSWILVKMVEVRIEDRKVSILIRLDGSEYDSERVLIFY